MNVRPLMYHLPIAKPATATPDIKILLVVRNDLDVDGLSKFDDKAVKNAFIPQITVKEFKNIMILDLLF